MDSTEQRSLFFGGIHGVYVPSGILTSVLTASSANNVFHTPTRPTYSRIVTFVKPTGQPWVGFYLLILLYIVLVLVLVLIAPI